MDGRDVIIKTKPGQVIQCEGKDDESGRTYKYFALEGITKGSFIEYMYVVKRPPSYTGRRVNLQAAFHKKTIEFDLFSPKNLVFAFKSFNGLPDVQKDTVTTEKLHWELHVTDMKKLENEYQAAYEASKQFLVYKLDGNLATNATGIIAYNTIAQNLYGSYYPEYAKKTQSLINDFIKELKLAEKDFNDFYFSRPFIL